MSRLPQLKRRQRREIQRTVRQRRSSGFHSGSRDTLKTLRSQNRVPEAVNQVQNPWRMRTDGFP
eukprot:1137723-Amphidinium_carterae.1